MIVGFTGTREGMSAEQVKIVARLLRELRPTEIHHGCCIGADEQLHAITRRVWPLHGHPGPDGPLKAVLAGFSKIYPIKDYGPRNQDIVDSCDVLVATPKETAEATRGGTWQTVRRARKAKKRIIIVWPDGRTT